MTGATSPRLQLELLVRPAAAARPRTTSERGFGARARPAGEAGGGGRRRRPAGRRRRPPDRRHARAAAPARPGAGPGAGRTRAGAGGRRPTTPARAPGSRARGRSGPAARSAGPRPPAATRPRHLPRRPSPPPARLARRTSSDPPLWPEVLTALSGIKRATWSLVSQHAQVLDYDGGRLLLGFGSAGLATSFGRGVAPGVPSPGADRGGRAGLQDRGRRRRPPAAPAPGRARPERSAPAARAPARRPARRTPGPPGEPAASRARPPAAAPAPAPADAPGPPRPATARPPDDPYADIPPDLGEPPAAGRRAAAGRRPPGTAPRRRSASARRPPQRHPAPAGRPARQPGHPTPRTRPARRPLAGRRHAASSTSRGDEPQRDDADVEGSRPGRRQRGGAAPRRPADRGARGMTAPGRRIGRRAARLARAATPRRRSSRPGRRAGDRRRHDRAFRLASVTKLSYRVRRADRRRGGRARARRRGRARRARPCGTCSRTPPGYGFESDRGGPRPARHAADLLQPGDRGGWPRHFAAASGIPFGEYLARGGARAARAGAPPSCAARRRTPSGRTAADLARFAARAARADAAGAARRWRTWSRCSSPGCPACCPGIGRFDPLDWGLGFERNFGRPAALGRRARCRGRRSATSAAAGTFLWVDPVLSLAAVCLTDRDFGDVGARRPGHRCATRIIADHAPE